MANYHNTDPLELAPWVPTPGQMRFMVWDLTPKKKRNPPLQKDLAQELGVSEQTMCAWRNLPRWAEYRNVFIMMKLNASIPDIMNALIEDLTDPANWQARRDFIRYGMPFMGNVMQDPRIIAIQQSDATLLPAKTLDQVMSSLPSEHRLSVLQALEDLGAIQPELAPDAAPDSNQSLISVNPTLDYGQYTREVQDEGLHYTDEEDTVIVQNGPGRTPPPGKLRATKKGRQRR